MAKAEDRSVGATNAADTMAAPAGTTEEAASISLRDIEGTWKVRSTDERGGNPVETEMHLTADTSKWTMIGPNKKSIPVHVVAIAGDSFVTVAAPEADLQPAARLAERAGTEDGARGSVVAHWRTLRAARNERSAHGAE